MKQKVMFVDSAQVDAMLRNEQIAIKILIFLFFIGKIGKIAR